MDSFPILHQSLKEVQEEGENEESEEKEDNPLDMASVRED